MAQTSIGGIKCFCNRNGLNYDEYVSNQEKGLKWCTGCKEWHPVREFGTDRSRWDKMTASCLNYRRRIQLERYKPVPRKVGRFFEPPRGGDKKQARARVNYFISIGLFAHPNTLPCTDCEHVWKNGERRHEYDHHLGYDGENQLRVEPVCTTCHVKREKKRGTVGNRKRKKTGQFA